MVRVFHLYIIFILSYAVWVNLLCGYLMTQYPFNTIHNNQDYILILYLFAAGSIFYYHMRLSRILNTSYMGYNIYNRGRAVSYTSPPLLHMIIYYCIQIEFYRINYSCCANTTCTILKEYMQGGQSEETIVLLIL